MSLEELIKKYNNVPEELKVMNRWVCFKVEGMNNGKTTKRPYNPMTGSLAKVNDELTWSKFNTALKGCIKYRCDGIGFILGNGIFGIDLDNHPDENGEFPMTPEEFKDFSNEFVDALDSYAETSQSGLGVHIICQGQLPKGGRRKGCVEMYDSGRFFAFTGDVIRKVPINNREKEIIPLWEKYVNVKQQNNFKSTYEKDPNREVLRFSDEDLINIALSSSNADIFYKYYHDGDISLNKNDHSSADMSFCNLLAFWCNKDVEQMDRIFRNSALMRDKWDEKRGARTYGEITLSNACENVSDTYTPYKPSTSGFSVRNKEEKIQTKTEIENDIFKAKMNIDKNGEPIFKIKKNFNKYPYTDTGNANRFYDYFGDLFKYNVTDKIFMFWTGKTWIRDTKDIIRKYANKFIDILKAEEKSMEADIENLEKHDGEKELVAKMKKVLEACQKNTNRVANKAGKDAMLSEFKSLHDVPINSSEFNQYDFLLNTDSGVVNLETGEISDFDKNKLLSKNTNVEVSYEKPEIWLKFLYSVFDNGNTEETNNLIESLQTCLGYSLSGSTREQVMFLLYGGGSNGKSTMTEAIAEILGDYADNIASSVLMQQKATNNAAMYSIAKLQTVRFVETGETDDGGKLAEAQVKILTGGDSISAQFKYGNEFSFKPKFKIWMSTNNRPIIRGTDLGIWRRLFMFPFLNSFTGDKKDKHLPEKLKKEAPKILGWAIQGFQKYQKNGDLIQCDIQKNAIKEYKDQMDVVAQFIKKECILNADSQTDCKELYAHYKTWASDNTEFTTKESKFSDDLKTKGIKVVYNSNGRKYYKGIAIAGVFTVRNKES